MKVEESVEIEGDLILLGRIYPSDGHYGTPGQVFGIKSNSKLGYIDVAGGGGINIAIVATEDIPAFSAVTSSGKKGDSSNSAHYGKVIGINSVAILNGFSGNIVKDGEVTNPSWAWSVGDLIFLNGTILSKIAPSTGFIQYLGIAKSPTTIIVDIALPINL